MTDTDLPPGPELDRLVAECLGIPVGGYADQFTGELLPHPLPAFSTDDGTQAEKLAWLLPRCGDHLEFMLTSSSVSVTSGFDEDDPESVGTTIQHALALLCVAVAEREMASDIREAAQALMEDKDEHRWNEAGSDQ